MTNTSSLPLQASSETTDFKTVFIDIETSPNLAWIWGKYEQNALGFDQEWHLLSFSVKEAGSRTIKTYALPDFPLYQKDPTNDRELAKKLWEELNAADLVIAHNGDKFDIKKANARFIFHGFGPPAPYKTLDTLKIARKYFAFTSNKLDDLAQHLGIGKKVPTGGFELWLGCMQGDEKSWRKMKKYNAHDVVLLEAVYELFKGWITTHPNINMKDSPRIEKCPNCGSTRLQSRGWYNIKAYRARQFRCMGCGHWPKGDRQRIPGKLLT